jgi:23S rRNA (pseudouridine1915-N3)-methyltransferase
VLSISSKTPTWLDSLTTDFKKKISFWFTFETIFLKSPSHAREDRKAKLKAESALLMKALSADDYVILCDEAGLAFTSEKFANRLESIFQSGKKRLTFIVGGAYGVGPEVKVRADFKLKLSDFITNHYLAVALIEEQIYRALTIIKNVSYHNAET